MEDNQKFINLARKLKRLADSGVGGEKENASEKLRLIMEKYDISIHDIEGEIRKDYDVHFHKDIPMKFIIQVLSSVVGNISKSGCDLRQYKYNRKKNHHTYQVVNIEPEHFTEFVIKVQTYWEDYNKQMEIFYSAYVQKNKLYTKPDENEEKGEQKPLTPEERAEIYKMLSMMEGIERVNIQKRIG
jgi:hypothetical protein